MGRSGTAGPSGEDDGRRTLIDEVVTLPGMAQLRAHVLRLAAQAGLSTNRAQAFVVAVNEALSNVVQHAGGRGELAVLQDGEGRLIAEVRDAGPGMPCSVPLIPPSPEATRGRGMWLAGQLADHIEVRADHHGSLVRLAMDL